MNAEQAKEVWGPVIERIVAEPALAKFIDSYFRDAEKQKYIDQCSAYYDAETPAPAAPAAPASVPVDPIMRQQLTELQAWKGEREKREAVDRYNGELAQVQARFPFVTADPGLLQDLRDTAKNLWAADHNKGLLDALAIKAPLYEAIATARAAGAPAPVPTPVPAALGTTGAAPGGSRPRTNTRPRKIALGDATAAWMAEHPDGFQE
jgi:hypothetical protein